MQVSNSLHAIDDRCTMKVRTTWAFAFTFWNRQYVFVIFRYTRNAPWNYFNWCTHMRWSKMLSHVSVHACIAICKWVPTNNVVLMFIDSKEIIKTSDRKYATFNMKMMNVNNGYSAFCHGFDLYDQPTLPTSHQMRIAFNKV